MYPTAIWLHGSNPWALNCQRVCRKTLLSLPIGKLNTRLFCCAALSLSPPRSHSRVRDGWFVLCPGLKEASRRNKPENNCVIKLAAEEASEGAECFSSQMYRMTWLYLTGFVLCLPLPKVSRTGISTEQWSCDLLWASIVLSIWGRLLLTACAFGENFSAHCKLHLSLSLQIGKNGLSSTWIQQCSETASWFTGQGSQSQSVLLRAEEGNPAAECRNMSLQLFRSLLAAPFQSVWAAWAEAVKQLTILRNNKQLFLELLLSTENKIPNTSWVGWWK